MHSVPCYDDHLFLDSINLILPYDQQQKVLYVSEKTILSIFLNSPIFISVKIAHQLKSNLV